MTDARLMEAPCIHGVVWYECRECGQMPDLDPRWPRLLAAARSWQANLIPRTSTSTQGPTRVLLEAIEAFDQEPPKP